jgi:hypothetical protein
MTNGYHVGAERDEYFSRRGYYLLATFYKKLVFAVSIIDNFLNDPQATYKKNSFQLTTGYSSNLH